MKLHRGVVAGIVVATVLGLTHHLLAPSAPSDPPSSSHPAPGSASTGSPIVTGSQALAGGGGRSGPASASSRVNVSAALRVGSPYTGPVKGACTFDGCPDDHPFVYYATSYRNRGKVYNRLVSGARVVGAWREFWAVSMKEVALPQGEQNAHLSHFLSRIDGRAGQREAGGGRGGRHPSGLRL
jgi:hypothetical protein